MQEEMDVMKSVWNNKQRIEKSRTSTSKGEEISSKLNWQGGCKGQLISCSHTRTKTAVANFSVYLAIPLLATHNSSAAATAAVWCAPTKWQKTSYSPKFHIMCTWLFRKTMVLSKHRGITHLARPQRSHDDGLFTTTLGLKKFQYSLDLLLYSSSEEVTMLFQQLQLLSGSDPTTK